MAHLEHHFTVSRGWSGYNPALFPDLVSWVNRQVHMFSLVVFFQPQPPEEIIQQGPKQQEMSQFYACVYWSGGPSQFSGGRAGAQQNADRSLVGAISKIIIIS